MSQEGRDERHQVLQEQPNATPEKVTRQNVEKPSRLLDFVRRIRRIPEGEQALQQIAQGPDANLPLTSKDTQQQEGHKLLSQIDKETKIPIQKDNENSYNEESEATIYQEREEFMGKIQEWSRKRWDIERTKKYGTFFRKRERIRITPKIDQMNDDSKIVVEQGSRALLENMLVKQGGLTREQAAIKANELPIDYANRVSLRLYTRMSDAVLDTDIKNRIISEFEINKNKLIDKMSEEEVQKHESEKEEQKYQRDHEKSQSDEEIKSQVNEWMNNRWYKPTVYDYDGSGTTKHRIMDIPQVREDAERINEYQGEDGILREILINQGGLTEEEADRKMGDAHFAYLTAPLMRKRLNYIKAAEKNRAGPYFLDVSGKTDGEK